jgi:hypothetical protein
MRHSRRSGSRPWLLGSLALAGLSALAVALPATPASAGTVVAAHAAADSAALTPTARGSSLARANPAAGTSMPVGGVLGDVTGDGLADIVAIDPAGNLWLYPNTGSAGAGMFSGGRSQVGSGWKGYTLAAVVPLYGATQAGLLAIDPAGNLWYYPNTGGSGLSTFGTRSQVGILWTDNTIVGVGDLYGTGSPGILDVADAGNPAANVVGNLYYYANQGGTGLSTFSFGSNVGQGWTGYTADLADINGDGKPDILAADPAGNLWLYANTGVTGTPFAGRSQVGSGWSGYQAIDVGQLTSTGPASILAIDRAGNLWFYPNTGGTGTSTFGARVQVGSGWTGYTIN